MQENKKLCSVLFDEFIMNVEESELEQSKEIITINYNNAECATRLCLLDPMPITIDNEEYYRVSRIIVSHDGSHHNLNVNLRGKGINIFAKWSYNLEEQKYLLYHYNMLLEEFSCPPTMDDILSSLRDKSYCIREDKWDEYRELIVFLIKNRELTYKMNKLRQKIHDKRFYDYVERKRDEIMRNTL